MSILYAGSSAYTGRVVEELFDVSTLSPKVWLDSNTPSSIIETSGSVSEWQDLSGNGNHVTQATGALQPTTNSRTFSGRNVIDFDGSEYLHLTAFGSATSKPVTIFAVGAWDNSQSALSEFMFSGGTSSTRTSLLTTNTGLYDLFAGVELKPKTANDLTHVHEVVFNNASSFHHIDGVQVASGNTGNENMNGLSVGSDHAGNGLFNGFIGEIVIFDRILSDVDRAQMYDYLDNKWYDMVDTIFEIGQSNADGGAFNIEDAGAISVGDSALATATATFYDTKQDNLFIYQKPTERVGNGANASNYTDDGEWWNISKGYDAVTKETHQTCGNGTDVVWTPQRHGVELELAFKYATATPTKELRIFKTGIGGSAIETDWAVTAGTTGKLYDYFKTHVWQPALDDMLLAGKKPNIKGIIWIQGEADAINGQEASYATRLQDLVDRLNADFMYTNPEIYVTSLSSYATSAGNTIRSAQTTVATNNTNVTVVDTTGYTKQSDNIHYTALGFEEMATDLYALIF